MSPAQLIIKAERITSGHPILGPESIAVLALLYEKGEIRARDVSIELGLDVFTGPPRLHTLRSLGYVDRVARGVYKLSPAGFAEASKLFDS